MAFKKIAFIGATGMLGKPVVRALVSDRFDITALVRDVEKAKQVLPSNVQLLSGDIRHEKILEQLLTGQDAVYINLGIKPDEKSNDFHSETDGLKNILRAAKKTGLRRVLFVSSLVMNYQGMNGFSWWAFDVKKKAVAMIRESGIPHTIFYPSTFMENFGGNYRRGNMIMLVGTSRHPMYFIAGDDFGKQVARSLTGSPEGNKEYTIQGPEAFTTDEAAAVYVAHYRKTKLKISRTPLGLLKFLGNFNRTMHYGAHIIEAMNQYPEEFESQKTWDELGRPMITLQQYASQQ